MFSTRTPSQEPSTNDVPIVNNNEVNSPIPTEPVSNPPSVDEPVEPTDPDCSPTYVKMQLQIVPEWNVTICKPKIKVKNKAICVENCECEGCV